jgi:pimeloyl-ACP methyl ester carboxylesterase
MPGDEASKSADRPRALGAAVVRVKLWHLGLLVAFVAFAIVDIRDHRRTEPVLIVLAGAGFAAYAVLAWLGWNLARRFEERVGRLTLIGLYLASMAGLFLLATVAYLLIEHVYLGGRF